MTRSIFYAVVGCALLLPTATAACRASASGSVGVRTQGHPPSLAIKWPDDVVAVRQGNAHLDKYLRLSEERLHGAARRLPVLPNDVVIELTLDRFGEVTRSVIERSSGSVDSDRVALKAFAVVIGPRPKVVGVSCSGCPWYIRVTVRGRS